MRKQKRIGILGGSFNPIHLGHLILAEQAKAALNLERVIFIPVNLPSHKESQTLVGAKERYLMVRLAIKTNPDFAASDLEIKRAGTSYSIETIKALKSLFHQARLFFIVGSDFVKEYLTWKDIATLRRMCKFVIAPRPSFPFNRLPDGMQAINISALDISSSQIRRRIRANKSIRYLVPEEVRKYIVRKKLYC